MKILIVSHYAGGPEYGMVYRTYMHARAWAEAGHEVTVAAASFAHTRHKQPDIQGNAATQTIDGVRYLWLRTSAYTTKSMLGRVRNMFEFAARLYRNIPELRERYDVIMLSVPSPFAIYPVRRMARRMSARLIVDVRDLWPLTLTLLGGVSEKHPFIRLVGAAQRAACRAADLVTAVPRNAEAYLITQGLRAGRFLPVANGVMPEVLAAEPLPESHAAALGALRDRGAFVIGYAGAIGVANAMHVPIEALAGLPDKFHLAIVGEGAERDTLQARARQLNVDHRVLWLPLVRRAQVLTFLKDVDVVYAGALASPLYAYGASFTKLNDYMLSHKPIVYAVGDAGNGVEASGCGISCPAEDVPAVRVAFARLGAMPADALAGMGDKGYTWCNEHQDASRQVARILDRLAEVAA